jgi:hypothetical protein
MFRNREGDEPNKIPKHNGDPKPEGTHFGASLGWELGVDYPTWGNTEIYVKTISKGYLMKGETPKDAYWRVCTTVAKRLGKPEMACTF